MFPKPTECCWLTVTAYRMVFPVKTFSTRNSRKQHELHELAPKLTLTQPLLILSPSCVAPRTFSWPQSFFEVRSRWKLYTYWNSIYVSSYSRIHILRSESGNAHTNEQFQCWCSLITKAECRNACHFLRKQRTHSSWAQLFYLRKGMLGSCTGSI